MNKELFLPVTKEEMHSRGWDEIDIVLITGDAYVDHPSFASAVLGRLLESRGYRVGIIAMPDWKDPESINVFGKPALFYGIASGAVDSMIANYTATKKRRSDDPYAPGGNAGHRPDRAVIAYSNLIKRLYKDVPIVIGGIEASMRRIPHYDFWDNKVRRSIIEDSRADILVYGMGEIQIETIADRISSDESLNGIPGTVVISKEMPDGAVMLPSSEDVINDKKCFLNFYNLFFSNLNKTLAVPSAKRYLIHYPPPEMNSEKLDEVYALPFIRQPHPVYKEQIPAFEMIKNSITSHRGCVSGCSFCSLSLHQGKKIISRTQKSVLREIDRLKEDKDFKGRISDIGGPSANMYGFDCAKKWKCIRESCIDPSLCRNLVFNTKDWVDLLDRACTDKIKSVTIGSGIRYDIFMKDKNYDVLLKQIVKSHISGQLKIAPEHTSKRVLRAMRKTPVFELKNFIKLFKEYTSGAGKKQYIIPYFMSCHPGCLYNDMAEAGDQILSLFGFVPDQVQMFIPLPMTLSSVIFYTGADPLTFEEFPVEHDMGRKKKQHDIFRSRSY